MASKKGTLERAVEEQEGFPTTTRRVRSSEIMGKPRGTITPDQWDQWTNQNKAAHDADMEDLASSTQTGIANMNRRIPDYKKGGAVRGYCKGGKVISSKNY
jgi:hypothetical protein